MACLTGIVMDATLAPLSENFQRIFFLVSIRKGAEGFQKKAPEWHPTILVTGPRKHVLSPTAFATWSSLKI